jgi:transcriptional regulator of acetoin/glycerol metabolism
MALIWGSEQVNREWHLLQKTQPNVLVIGPDAAIEEALHALVGVSREPVTACRAASPLVLPNPATTGALILRDVDTLTPNGQRRLMEWLEAACGATQVLATSTGAVWPLVKAGLFLEALYYRLNVIYIDLTDGESGGGGQAFVTQGEHPRRL